MWSGQDFAQCVIFPGLLVYRSREYPDSCCGGWGYNLVDMRSSAFH